MSFSTRTGEFLGKKVVSFFFISEFFKDQVVIVNKTNENSFFLKLIIAGIIERKLKFAEISVSGSFLP